MSTPSTPVRHLIHPLLASRWSPRALVPEVIPPLQLDAILEAARWAPSCFNGQPWELIVAERGQPAFAAVLACLTEFNQVWARNAGAFVVVCSAPNFSHNGKPNRWNAYDTGAAGLAMCLQAQTEGFVAHQMGGFDTETLRASTGLPADHAIHSVIAIGRQGPAATLPDDMADREQAPRQRRTDFAHHGTYGTPRPAHAAIEEVLEFWFGALDENGLSSQATAQRWFRPDPDFDATIRERFGELYDRAAAGLLDGWASSARGRLALIVVLDQFSRNLFRDQAAMYDQDPRSLQLTLEGIEHGLDVSLALQECVFFLMPLMHSEALADQELGVAAFAALAAEAPDAAKAMVQQTVDYAQQHLDIVARWGRFPHRNERLGRPSTEAELTFLQTPGSSF